MTTAYPGAIDSLTNPTPSDTLNSATVPHAAQHANINDAVEAIQATLGTNPQGTSSTVKDRIAAAEGAIINLGQDLDTRVPGETGSNAPTGTLPNGYVWVNTTDNSLKVWNGTTWVDPSNAGGGSTGPEWAVVSGGTVTEYTHPTYGLMSVHTFTGNGTLTVSTAGFAEVLISGGGWIAGATEAGARMADGFRSLPAAAHAVTVGTVVGSAGNADADVSATISRLGTVVSSGPTQGAFSGAAGYNTGAGGVSGNLRAGRTSSITGSAVTYAAGTATSTPGSVGQPGVVIVAVKKP